MNEKSSVLPDKTADTYRILHTADWHLGKLLNEKSREEEHDLFLQWLLEKIVEHGIDAVILAGDVFDSANPPQSALTRYFNFVSELYRRGDCALAVIAGNHDSAAQLEAPKQVLQALNTHVRGYLAEKPEDRILYLPSEKDPKVAIAMMPFLRDRDLRVGKAGESSEEIKDKLVEGIRKRYQESGDTIKKAKSNCPSIATGHLTVVNLKKSDSEREIHIGGLEAVGPDSFPEVFSYVALGHLHRPQTSGNNDRLRYSGSPIPLSFSEASDQKEVRILDVTKGEITNYGLPIPLFRRLVQLTTTKSDIEDTIGKFNPDTSDLTTWVEVIVEDGTSTEDLNERVRLASEGCNFEVLKILRNQTVLGGGMRTAKDCDDDEAFAALLDNPSAVFEHLLKHQEVEGREAKKLKTVFQILIETESQDNSGSLPEDFE